MKTWIGCTANWTNTNVEDAKWWIIRNEEQEELARLPYSLGEHGVMELVHKIRDLETDSYEAGKEFGGQAMMAAGRQKMKEMADACNKLAAHNTYLADKLESLIGAKED
jgi:hypothetical protein